MTDAEPPIDRLWRDAVRQHLASMPPEEIAGILAEVRSDEPGPEDIAPKGTIIPSLGQQPTPRPTEGAEAIRIAEQSGDWATAARLKTAQLRKLARDW